MYEQFLSELIRWFKLDVQGPKRWNFSMSQQQPGLAKSLQKQIKTCVSQLCFVFFLISSHKLIMTPKIYFVTLWRGPIHGLGTHNIQKGLKPSTHWKAATVRFKIHLNDLKISYEKYQSRDNWLQNLYFYFIWVKSFVFGTSSWT